MATKKLYYYFGKSIVYVFDTPTTDFEELSKDQISFYKACEKENYKATLTEIRNCEKVVPPFNLKAYQYFQIGQISNMSLCEAERVFPPYQRRNADLGIYKNSSQLLENEKQLAIRLREEFYRLKSAVLQAETKEAIDEVVASNAFANIADSFDFKSVENE